MRMETLIALFPTLVLFILKIVSVLTLKMQGLGKEQSAYLTLMELFFSKLLQGLKIYLIRLK